jgi:hypothetical protein
MRAGEAESLGDRVSASRRSRRRRAKLFLAAMIGIVVGCNGERPKAADTDDASTPNSTDRRNDASPAAATLRLDRTSASAGESIELAVLLKISPGWEVHALGAADPAAMTIELKLPADVTVLGDWIAPPTTSSMRPEGGRVYASDVQFVRRFAVAADAQSGERAFECVVQFQVCNEHLCLQPEPVVLSARLTIPPR